MNASKLGKFFGFESAGAQSESGKTLCSGGCGCAPAVDEGRRKILAGLAVAGAGTALAVVAGCDTVEPGVDSGAVARRESPQDEALRLRFKEQLRKNFRIMTDDEKRQTVERLERLAWLEQGADVEIRTTAPREGVLFGYAFNVSKCEGYMECVKACVEENNQDRATNMQYIKIWEMEPGSMSLESANGSITHEVPAEGHFYLGTQCFHCENPPCTKVCPVGATWKEKDGIVVVDYDWCIGCRYCEAACPYFGRRFNWQEPEVPVDQINGSQHYLGNRLRTKGVMEKCTFCVARSREGKNPACVEACPTGARVFGNLLDPDSDIRQVLATKKVFRLKEDLGTEPKFWYFTD